MANVFLQIQKPVASSGRFALFALGFRPFFLLAGVFAVVSVPLWAAAYVGFFAFPRSSLPGIAWHGHEMIFGYAFAVIAGFLLTAVRNWTQVPTLRGVGLALLALAWLGARLIWLFAPAAWVWAAVLDLVFGLGLVLAILFPILRVRQWKQLGIVAKVVAIALANGLFYWALAREWGEGLRWGLMSGVYLVLALVFVMARRVLPFFIERGVDEPVTLRNRAWLEGASLVLLTALFVLDVFGEADDLAGGLAALLFVVHGLRLYDWYTPALWRKPMLWILYGAYAAATLGFALKAAAALGAVAPQLALHAWTVGGMGMMTLGMMARVSLGHTGRSVLVPPSAIVPAFGLSALAFFLRVVGPLLLPAAYATWIVASGLAWALAFALFLWVYAPMLARPRLDGQPG